MYNGFNLSFPDLNKNEYREYYLAGKLLFKRYRRKSVENLNNYLNATGALEGSDIQNDWFQPIECDIFLSHSHKDEETVIILAGFFYKNFGLKTFIDSCVWGYAPDLIKKIDDNYCVVKNGKQGSKTYSYEKRNFSTSHVYMMLSMALSEMIDRTECLMFYNTPSSIPISKSMTEGSTYSPWIYHEIQMSKIIRTQLPTRQRHFTKDIRSDGTVTVIDNALKIKYDVNYSHLIELDIDDINKWRNDVNNTDLEGSITLDILYKQKGIY